MPFGLRPVHSKQQRYTMLGAGGSVHLAGGTVHRAGGSVHLIPMISTGYKIEAKCPAAGRRADRACMHVLLMIRLRNICVRTRHQ